MLRVNKSLDIKSKNSFKIIELLTDAGAKARLIGGVVRDSLLGVPTSDIDIATDFTPSQVIAILEAKKIKVIPTGIKFGTVTALLGGEVFEITTLRRDLSCDGRHARIEYSNDFYEDAERRDFTINALSYCPLTHEIYDYFGGIDDLDNRKVVFIGDAKERIREDYLRILRFFRFSCKYAKELNEEGLAACIRFKDTLKLLSRERIKQEMDKILTLLGSPYILSKMYEAGIMQIIFPTPNYNLEWHLRALNMAQSFDTALTNEVIYAILLNSDLKDLMDLKFSRGSAMKIIKLMQIKQSLSVESLTTLLKTFWLEEKSFTDYFVFASSLVHDNKFIFDLYNNLKYKKPQKFPINGNDLKKLGFEGKILGDLIYSLRIKWIESDFALNKEQLIKLAEKK